MNLNLSRKRDEDQETAAQDYDDVPSRMSELIETYAKNHKITLEQAVGDLVFNGLMSMSFWNTTKKILDKIFPKKTG